MIKKKSLLNYCGLLGVAAFLSYTAAVVFSPLAYPGYDWMAQAVSDLSASNSPSLRLWNQLSSLYNVCTLVCAMMGEYIIYYRGRIAGGIYDDRLLVKPTKSAVSYMTTAIYELPYEGAKEMLLVENVDSREYLAGLFNAMYDELPVHKSNNKKKSLNNL